MRDFTGQKNMIFIVKSYDKDHICKIWDFVAKIHFYENNCDIGKKKMQYSYKIHVKSQNW